MNTAIIALLDRELPNLRGAERDDLAAKIATVIAVSHTCPKCQPQPPKRKRGRRK